MTVGKTIVFEVRGKTANAGGKRRGGTGEAAFLDETPRITTPRLGVSNQKGSSSSGSKLSFWRSVSSSFTMSITSPTCPTAI